MTTVTTETPPLFVELQRDAQGLYLIDVKKYLVHVKKISKRLRNQCAANEIMILPLLWRQELDLFKRQYLQLQVNVRYPEGKYLKHEEFQDRLYSEVFSEDAMNYYPPQRYQLRVLKELVKRIETSITDWEAEVWFIISHHLNSHVRFMKYICSSSHNSHCISNPQI